MGKHYQRAREVKLVSLGLFSQRRRGRVSARKAREREIAFVAFFPSLFGCKIAHAVVKSVFMLSHLCLLSCVIELVVQVGRNC